jgi:hypothetical protein
MFTERDADDSGAGVELDAAMANEELAERITVVRAIARISLPLPQQTDPCRVDRREAA